VIPAAEKREVILTKSPEKKARFLCKKKILKREEFVFREGKIKQFPQAGGDWNRTVLAVGGKKASLFQ